MGDDIPVLAQIVGVDVFDALTTDRPYRAATRRTSRAGRCRTKSSGAGSARILWTLLHPLCNRADSHVPQLHATA
jgi:HD-GYP domain-containing protein (c-di-GMP phosphodiesterase class II)